MRLWIAILCASLVAAATGAAWLKPTALLSDKLPPIKLSLDIPTRMGAWDTIEVGAPTITSPDQLDLINKIYQETFNRSYKNDAGDIVMLSTAYSRAQGDQSGVHFPEVCYPAQGFGIAGKFDTQMNADGTVIKLRRMTAARLGRTEHISYFVLIGTNPAGGGNRVKAAQMRYGVRGYIADGLLIRVSTISNDQEHSWKVHDDFITELVKNSTGGLGTRFSAARNGELLPEIGT